MAAPIPLNSSDWTLVRPVGFSYTNFQILSQSDVLIETAATKPAAGADLGARYTPSKPGENPYELTESNAALGMWAIIVTPGVEAIIRVIGE